MTSKSQSHPLLTAHAEAIKVYETANAETHPDASVQSLAGIKASARQKIDLAEMEMEIAGVTYEPWTPPAKSSVRKPSVSDGDLMTRIDLLTKLAADETRRGPVRVTAAKERDRLTAAAVSRGLIDAPAETETAKPARKTVKTSARKSATPPLKRTPAAKVASVASEATFPTAA